MKTIQSAVLNAPPAAALLKMPHRIGIDGCQLMRRHCGTRRYIVELCRVLDERLPVAQFYVYCPIRIPLPCNSPRWHCRSTGRFGRYAPVIWLKTLGSLLCARDHLDAFWGGYMFLPALPHSVRKVVTVHDLAFQVVPETLPSLHALSFKLFLQTDVCRADTVFSISQGTAQRLLAATGVASRIINPGVSAQFRPASAAEISACLQRYRIQPPYVLTVAAMEPRKNIETLLKSFLYLKNQDQLAGYKLVLVAQQQYRGQSTRDLLAQTTGEDFIWLEQVPDRHLRALYTGARLFVLPSIYEGFGIPLIEAAACGTRILAADTPETREAGGKGGLYVQPTLSGLAQGLRAALAAPQTSLPQSRLPNWKEGGRRLAQALLGVGR